MARILLYFFCSLILCAWTGGVRADERILWQVLVEDLERASFTLPTGMFSSSRVDLFRTALKKFDLKIIRAVEHGARVSTARELCTLGEAVLCINANFFDEQYKPLGLIIENGNMIQKMHRGGNTLTGVLQRTRDSVAIVHRLDFNSARVLDAIQAGPRLISSGQPVAGLHEDDVSHRRSGVCIDPDNRVVFYATTTTLFGLPAPQLQRTLLHRDIACWDALNLDGGSSTQLFYAGTSGDGLDRPVFEIKGEDEIPVVIALIEREQL